MVLLPLARAPRPSGQVRGRRRDRSRQARFSHGRMARLATTLCEPGRRDVGGRGERMTVGTEDNLATDALALIAVKGITIGVSCRL
jgi:hypothetical protein